MKTTYVLKASDLDITAYDTRKEAETAADKCGDDCHGFDSAETLEQIFGAGHVNPVELWNSLSGVEPVKRFESRSTAATRIFKQLRTTLGGEVETVDAEAAKPQAKPKKAPAAKKVTREAKPRKAPKKAKSAKAAKKQKREKAAKPANGDSKKAQVIAMISKKGGATLKGIMKATGWQPHTTRGMVATLKTKGGMNVESFKTDDGERAYRIA